MSPAADTDINDAIEGLNTDELSRLPRSPQLHARLTIAAMVVSAFGGAFASGAPTGLSIWDGVLRSLIAALFVAAAAASPRPLTIVAATVAVALSSSTWLVALAAGLLLAIGGSVLHQRHSWMQLVAAILAVQGLLRLPALGFFGLPSLIAGITIALVMVFGYRSAGQRMRRLIRRSLATVAVVVTLACLAGGLTLLGARSDVERGISAARGGLSAARDGDPAQVVAELEEAAQALTAAEERSSGLLAQPLRLVPIAAQHHRAVTTATRQGSTIAAQAARAVVDADISSITLSGGSVDLSALAAMEGDLVQTAELLEAGVRELRAARSPWLIPPVASRMSELTDEMVDVLPEAQIAAQAAQVLPGMLGQASPRRYFVAFGSPGEMREFGGIVSSWALLEFDAGTVRQIDAGRIRDLYDLVRAQPPLDDEDFPALYLGQAFPELWPQNVTSSPDIATVVRASQHLFDGLSGGSIDGFVYLDSYAMAAMLQFTGPVEISGVPGQITAANATEFFLDGQYRLESRDDLKSQAGEVFAAAFDGLLDRALPGPERLGQVLGPAARQGHLQVATFDDAENDFLQSIQLQRPFGTPFVTADSIAVVHSNGVESKLDLYLHRDITYDVTVDDSGALSARVEVLLTSAIPEDAPAVNLGELNPGTHVVFLSLYSRHPITSAAIGGTQATPVVFSEFGYSRYQVEVTIPPNMTQLVQFDLTGDVNADRPYTLEVWRQPLVNSDEFHVNYRTNRSVAERRDFTLDERTILSFED